MVLESTVICLDNSEWMRNGDYNPSRFEAQQDAASMLCSTRTESHPENTVGLLAMAGKNVELLVSPTEDIAKILAAFARLSMSGRPDFGCSIQIAQLALKHRKNKNGGQRIIVFIGSPINDDKKTLQKVGKQLKKNNVAIDIISMGEHEENQEKLLELVNATNSNDNCHLITVPPGVLPSDAILSSPLMQDTMGGMLTHGMGGGGSQNMEDGSNANNFAEYGGIDPSLDPELAMAIRASTEEARAREEARAAALTSTGTASTEQQQQHLGENASSQSPGPISFADEEDEDALLQRALELSMMSSMQAMAVDASTEDANQSTTTAEDSSAAESERPTDQSQEQPMDQDEDEDEIAMRIAMELSMQVADAPESQPQVITAPENNKQLPTTTTEASTFLDPAFVSQLLGSVDVDVNDPLIQAALAQMMAGNTEKKDNESKEDSNENANKRRKEGK